MPRPEEDIKGFLLARGVGVAGIAGPEAHRFGFEPGTPVQSRAYAGRLRRALRERRRVDLQVFVYREGVARVRGTLIFIGTILMIVALVFIIWGMVEVGQGKKGTWDIWPFYLIHGGVSMAAIVLFAIANKGREKPAAASAGGEEGP